MKKINVLLGLLIIVSLWSCQKDDLEESTTGNSVVDFNRFIYYNMRDVYYWTNQIPDLNPDEQGDSETFFYSLLYSQIDKWSYVTNDYQSLVNYFKGVSEEFGYSVRPYKWPDGTDRVIAYVEYVYPNTPASRAGLKRGDLIIKVGGEELTTENYTDLYYNTSINLGFGQITGGEIIDLGTSMSIVAEEISINPILKTNVFNLDDGTKVVYLAYTSFIADYNNELEQAFGEFKNQGATELILDLRYNGGGAVSTANLLASLIGPSTIKDQVFIKIDYNQNYMDYIAGEYSDVDEVLIQKFVGSDYGLNLSRVYVLTTASTASASELVMYSLSPYMNVIQIGEQTTGKYYASNTFYDQERNWAIQPIILRMENKDNSVDYSQGLNPDIAVDDFYNAELGSEEDKLTSIALDQITNTSASSASLKAVSSNKSELLSLPKKSKHPLVGEMYMN